MYTTWSEGREAYSMFARACSRTQFTYRKFNGTVIICGPSGIIDFSKQPLQNIEIY
jgi:hypothetical protein